MLITSGWPRNLLRIADRRDERFLQADFSGLIRTVAAGYLPVSRDHPLGSKAWFCNVPRAKRLFRSLGAVITSRTAAILRDSEAALILHKLEGAGWVIGGPKGAAANLS
jgi:hypothetical protein